MNDKIWNAIRLNNKEIDDVAISGDLFRMERMNDKCFWVCIYRENKRTAFWLEEKNGKIVATLSENDLNCKED